MDPFTQKLLERTKARKEYVEAKFAKTPQPLPRKRRSPLKEDNDSMAPSVTSPNSDCKDDDSPGKRQCIASSGSYSESPNAESAKENAAENCMQTTIVDQGIKNRLKALAQFHAGSMDEPVYDMTNVAQVSARNKSDDEYSNQPTVALSCSTPRQRSNRLATLAASINMWEDDLQNGSPRPNPRSLTESSSTPPSSSDGTSLSSSASFKTPSSESATSVLPPPGQSNTCTSTSPSLSTPKLDLASLQHNESPNSKIGRSSSTASSANLAPIKRRSSSFTSPTKSKPVTSDSAPSKAKQQKTKNMIWDQAIVSTLQAQGFVQSPSKSKLEYQYRESEKSGTSPRKSILKNRAPAQDAINKDGDRRSITPPVASSSPEGVIEPPKKSVKELAQMFKGVVTPPMPKTQKDPTELPLAARVAIFEKEASNTKQTCPIKNFKAPINAATSKTGAPENKVCMEAPPVKSASQTTAQFPVASASKNSASAPTSPSKVGKHTFQLHRQLFEHMQDWKQNEISAKLKEDRQKDLEVVTNRWSYKNKLVAQNAASTATSTSSSTKETSDVSLARNEKQQDVHLAKDERVSKPIPEPPPLPDEVDAADSRTRNVHRKLTVQFEKSLSDEESSSSDEEGYPIEGEADQDSSSFESQASEQNIDDGNSSERDEDEVDQEDNEEDQVRKATSIIDDLLSDESFALSDVDSQGKQIPREQPCLDSSILKEAFTKVSPMMAPKSDDFVKPAPRTTVTPFKNEEANLVTEDNREQPVNIENEVPFLMHTVSFYRRQKDATRLAPVRIVHRLEVHSPPQAEQIDDGEPSPCAEESLTIQEKIKQLQETVVSQQTIIAQTSQALNLCRSTIEFHGSAQQIEGERLLLIATHKRMACMNEIQRLKTEAGIGGSNTRSRLPSKGSLSISDLKLPLKKEFLQQTAFGKEGEFVHFFLCLLKHRAVVIATQMVSTMDNITNGAFHFPNLINIRELDRDFNVVVEVFGLQTEREKINKEQKTLANKKEKSKLTLTPKKRPSKRDLRMTSPSVQSPGGPSTVSTSSFAMIGFATVNIKSLQRKSWVLEKCPYISPLEGSLFMKVQCHSDFNTEEQGFLTMFEDVGGFGAWHRRWFALSTRYLSYWKYPDDVVRKEPIGRINLCQCVTPQVTLVPRDICARPHTFMLMLVKSPSHDDVDSLVVQSHSSYTSIKILLSADTKEERISWCQKLTKTLENIRAWDPDALHPIPNDPISANC